MIVFVINKHGRSLMPCQPRKARLLLESKKAKIVKYNPFTIQLLYGSTGYTQEINIWVDLGAKHALKAISIWLSLFNFINLLIYIIKVISSSFLCYSCSNKYNSSRLVIKFTVVSRFFVPFK